MTSNAANLLVRGAALALALAALAGCLAERRIDAATPVTVALAAAPVQTEGQIASLTGIAPPGAAGGRAGVLPPTMPAFKRAHYGPTGPALGPDLDAMTALGPVADRIVVHKMDRRLELMRQGEVIRTYPIDLGWQTLGHKQEEGDGRTPEGTYHIEMRNPSSAFHLSLKVSYPDPDDTARARARGRSPGGMIMIHGQPNDPRSYRRAQSKKDWTEGCIAVSNAAIQEIWTLVPDGTTIEIKP